MTTPNPLNLEPEELLKNLDEEQRTAATALVGPTCILAGAGTGKTRTITHRIAYGIAQGYFAANRVLALTYTNKAAAELRTRLRELGSGSVSVKTFHAAALSQLEFFWPQFAGAPAPSVIESKAKYIAQAAEALAIRLDSSAVRDLASEIEWRKFSMLSLEEYASIAADRPIVGGLSVGKNVELQGLYEQNKIQAQKIDWEDVLILTIGLLRSEPRALTHVQQQYRFFTVDEYQDISPLQHALLDLWLGKRSDLCVVGDPNQTIYSFTGASSTFLLDFASRFPDANVVRLTSNYRSTQSIVAFANRLTRNATNGGELVSQSDLGSTPTVQAFESVVDEAKNIAAAVSKKIAEGSAAKDHAILYRVNGQSEPFESALADLGIDYQVRGGERFFNRPEIQSAIRSVRAEVIANTGRELNHIVTDIAAALGWRSERPAEPGAAREKWEALNALLSILDEMPKGSTIANFATELDERQRSQHEPTKAAVTLSTIHAAKGLEWKHVYLVGLTEGYLPITYAKTDLEIAEEKRLLYVGVTRAEKSLSLSWPTRDVAGGRTREASRFLAELEPAN